MLVNNIYVGDDSMIAIETALIIGVVALIVGVVIGACMAGA